MARWRRAFLLNLAEFKDRNRKALLDWMRKRAEKDFRSIGSQLRDPEGNGEAGGDGGSP